MDRRRLFNCGIPALAVAVGMVFAASAQAAHQGGTGQAQKQEPAAGAHGAGAATSVEFNKLDTNSNGSISPQEAQAAPVVGKNFQTLDQNHDQQIDRSEFAAFDQQRMRVKRLGPPGQQVNPKQLQEAGGDKPTESWFTLPENQPDGGQQGGQ